MDPGTAIAISTLSAKVLSIIWKYYKDVEGAQSDIKLLSSELEISHDLMHKLQKLVEGNAKLPLAASLEVTIKQALSDLKILEDKLDPGTPAKAMRRLGKRALKWPFKKGEVEQWVSRFQRLKDTANLAINTDQTALIIDIDANFIHMKDGQEAMEQERQLAKLPIATDASFDSYHRQHETLCIQNTRVELLQQHREWGAAHPKPLYWLSGMAGTGKSTIARTLSHHFHSVGTLGGSFFFSRSSGEANNAVNFVGTLARHLANISPQMKKHVCEAISSHVEVTRQGLRNQWNELILAPLSKFQSTNRPTLNFVIDALDECGSDDEIRLILQLFVEVKSLKEVDLGVFVTSRPEVAIRLGFQAMPDIIHQKLDLRDVPRHIVEHDLTVFLGRELAGIGTQHMLSDWPKHEDVRSLVQHADCLFIYATTACRYIANSDWDPEESLSQVLSQGSARGGATAGLNKMYLQILTSSLIDDRNVEEVTELCERFKLTVGSVVTLFDELSISGLAKVLDLLIDLLKPGGNYTLQATAEDARRFVLSNRGIIEKAPLQTYASALVFCPSQSFVRQSYQDQMPTWLIRCPTVEDRWGNSVQALESTSGLNLCPKMAFSSDQRYLAVSLENCDIDLWNATTGALHSTLEGHKSGCAALEFLPNGTLMLVAVDGSIQLFDQVTGVLHRLIEPPTYDDRLPQLPNPSEKESKNPETKPAPSASILPNGDVAVLPHNGHLLVWSWDRDSWFNPGITIGRLHGFLSDGTLVVQSFLHEHSPEGLFLFDPRARTVRGLDAQVSPRAQVVVSSLDVIAWTSVNGTIELYQADVGPLGKLGLQRPLGRMLSALTFSPDGRFLVSRGEDGLQSWNLSTQARSIIDTLDVSLGSVVFSPDGKSLATTTCYGSIIRLYDFPPNATSSLGEVQSCTIGSVQLSPDGQQLAAYNTSSTTVQIFITEHGRLRHTLRGHSDMITALVFSHDSEQLASASNDDSIRLWFPKSGGSGSILSGVPGLENIQTLAFSPNEETLVSGSRAGKMMIFDTKSGMLNRVREFVQGLDVFDISFSSDGGRMIAYGKKDLGVGGFGVWDHQKGTLLYEFRDPGFRAAAISPSADYGLTNWRASLVVRLISDIWKLPG
ncbi:MAG: hypothetical protein Q9168_002730 [Polycauliona sp. 1 TL-2023]